jgi:predicted metalloendopeptidase
VKRLIIKTLALSLAAAFSHAADLPTPAAASGVDLQYIDPAVRAQDDFFAHLNGKWLKNTEIPADRSSWGTIAMLREQVQPHLRALIEEAGRDPANRAGSPGRKIADLYASFMDQERLDKLGYKPLTGELSRIRGLRDKKAIPALIAHLQKIGVAAPYAISVSQDSRASTRYAAYITQSGLGLPDRDYYLKQDDARLAGIRAKYEQHVAATLALAGHAEPARAAKDIVALETALAGQQWTRVQLRDPVKRYNKMDFAQLAALTPGFDWKAALAAAGVAVKTDYVIVAQPSYLSELDGVLAATDLATWKAYFEWQLLRSYAEFLSKPFADADFAFYGVVVTGTPDDRPRWKKGVATVETSLGEALGQRYAARHFPAERRSRMQQLVDNLLAAYRDSIDTLDWMGAETKREAQAKLAKFRPKIGYPDKWRDYAKLAIVRTDLAGNIMRARSFAYDYELGKLGKPVDRAEWGMTPQTVNAYYSSTMNEIVFPAGILQPPFFDMSADDAVNYGAIGAVIGHEISHGFDDRGSQSDGDGNLRVWWSDEDRARFRAKTDALVRQYSAYSPLPGYAVNGELTLGENIADNAGLSIAYKAYLRSLNGKPAPVIDGLTGEQRFYMGWGQVWRSKMREAQQIMQIKTDPHSPGQFRTNGSLRNQPGFHDAFKVEQGDRMYLAPAERVLIW